MAPEIRNGMLAAYKVFRVSCHSLSLRMCTHSYFTILRQNHQVKSTMSYDFSAAFGPHISSQTTKITTLKYVWKLTNYVNYPDRMHIIKTTFLPLRLPSTTRKYNDKEVEKLWGNTSSRTTLDSHSLQFLRNCNKSVEVHFVLKADLYFCHNHFCAKRIHPSSHKKMLVYFLSRWEILTLWCTAGLVVTFSFALWGCTVLRCFRGGILLGHADMYYVSYLCGFFS